MKPITLYAHSGPNPYKVAMILEELHLPYETKEIATSDLKKPEYEAICINGRTPAIVDPNTGLILWESGAIITYLVETYDTGHEKILSFEHGTTDAYHAIQWLYFQVSGQGPYFGQAVWFTRFHEEKLPSVQLRYFNEIKRVSGVLERSLQGKRWLVGNRYSFADVSFLMWFESVFAIVKGHFDIAQECPNLVAWLDRIKERPAVSKILKQRAEKLASK